MSPYPERFADIDLAKRKGRRSSTALAIDVPLPRLRAKRRNSSEWLGF